MEELEKLKQEIQSLESTIKILNEENQKRFRENCDLNNGKIKLNDKILELKIENIAELKASKILFKMVKGGYTHRQKNDIANNAIIVLDTDIYEKISDLRFTDKEVPF